MVGDQVYKKPPALSILSYRDGDFCVTFISFLIQNQRHRENFDTKWYKIEDTEEVLILNGTKSKAPRKLDTE